MTSFPTIARRSFFSLLTLACVACSDGDAATGATPAAAGGSTGGAGGPGAGGLSGSGGGAGVAGSAGTGGAGSPSQGGSSGGAGSSGSAGSSAGSAGTAGSASGGAGAGGSSGGAGGGACSVPPAIADTTTPAQAWEFHRLDPKEYATALCNDGSPGAYYLRPNTDSKRWLIFLEGGGACQDGKSCQKRWASVAGDPDAGNHDKMTTDDDAADWKNRTPAEGVFSAVAPLGELWRNANIVRVAYCSSDLWSGDAAAVPTAPESDARHWHFRGRSIATSVVDELMKKRGLASAADVVLAGGSAGGGGVYSLVDDIAALVPPAARYLGMSDAGFSVDFPEMGAAPGDPTPLQSMGLDGEKTWGGRGDASCFAGAGSDLLARARCRSGVDLLQQRQIATPILTIVSQLDQVQLNRLKVGVRDSKKCVAPTQQERTYALKFLDEGMVPALSLAATEPRYSHFATYGCAHVLINGPDDREDEWVADGVKLADAIKAFHSDPCAPGRHVEPKNASMP